MIVTIIIIKWLNDRINRVYYIIPISNADVYLGNEKSLTKIVVFANKLRKMLLINLVYNIQQYIYSLFDCFANIYFYHEDL